MIYWANQHTAMVSGVWWWIVFPVLLVIMTFIGLFLLAVSMNEYIDPRSRLGRMGGGRHERRAGPRRRRDLRAYYQMRAFGVDARGAGGRRHQLEVAANEIYGLAGESSCGKTTLIKTIAAAIRPPLNVVGGSVTLQLPDRRDRHPRARPRGAGGGPLEAPVLHHAGLDERAEPGAPGAAFLRRLRLPPHRPGRCRSSSRSSRRISRGCTSRPRCSTPIRTSCRAACASAWRSRSPRSAGPSSSSPTSRPPRSTSSCRRACWR